MARVGRVAGVLLLAGVALAGACSAPVRPAEPDAPLASEREAQPLPIGPVVTSTPNERAPDDEPAPLEREVVRTGSPIRAEPAPTSAQAPPTLVAPAPEAKRADVKPEAKPSAPPPAENASREPAPVEPTPVEPAAVENAPIERAPIEQAARPEPAVVAAPRPEATPRTINRADPGASRAPMPAPEPIIEPPSDTTRVTPIAPEFNEGLEIDWWITPDASGTVGRVLGAYADRPSPMPASVRERWARAGFRVVAIDESEVHDVLQALKPVGLVRRDWIGRKVRWNECFRPPEEERLAPERIMGLPRAVRPERLRFLARAWSSPGAETPVLRVDLALQLFTPKPPDGRITLDEPTLAPAESEGEIFEDVTAELALRAGQVLVITGEAPGVTWGAQGSAPARPDEEADGGAGAVPAERFDPAVAPPTRSGEGEGAEGAPIGPVVEQPTTLGQAMLAPETSAIYPAPTRTIILIMPRVPDGFSLLP